MNRIIIFIVTGLTISLIACPQPAPPAWIRNFSQSEMCSRDAWLDALYYKDSLIFTTGYTEKNFN